MMQALPATLTPYRQLAAHSRRALQTEYMTVQAAGAKSSLQRGKGPYMTVRNESTLLQHPIREPGRALGELQRVLEIEIVEHRVQVREGGRLCEQLEGQAVAGVVGVQQVAR